MDLYSLHQEREREQKMSDVRREITSQFQAIAVDLKQQIERQLREVETGVYGQIEEKIAEARQQVTSEIATSNDELNRLLSVRREVESLLKDIQKAAAPSIV
ncbi:hypothetical protein ACQ4M3_42365 [Leptolyngbya sp. AN03gr2]|uniref:hypothetical protein n=1 Tax=unclassified Leptolyngbya TaxID=2650499 RepID=UPI003D316183